MDKIRYNPYLVDKTECEYAMSLNSARSVVCGIAFFHIITGPSL